MNDPQAAALGLPETGPLLTVGEVREILGIGHSTMTKWLRAGKIRKVDGTHKIARLELVRFLEEASRPKPPESRRRGPYKIHGAEQDRTRFRSA